MLHDNCTFCVVEERARREAAKSTFFRLHVHTGARYPTTAETVVKIETAENGELVATRKSGALKVFPAGWKNYDLVPDTEEKAERREQMRQDRLERGVLR